MLSRCPDLYVKQKMTLRRYDDGCKQFLTNAMFSTDDHPIMSFGIRKSPVDVASIDRLCYDSNNVSFSEKIPFMRLHAE